MISMNNINKTYKSGTIYVEALKNIDLDIKDGEFISIIGHSGSGKSTLMNLLGGLDTPTKGSYILNNVLFNTNNENELAEIRNKQIGFVFQTFNLLPRQSALRNVELPLIYAGISGKERKIKAINSLEIVGLSDRAMHKPNEMSGGEKQRVAIARALINDPSIILADEPTGNLDSKTTHEILDLLEELNKLGKTVIIITHEEDVASRTNRMITLKDGKIISDKKVGNENI